MSIQIKLYVEELTIPLLSYLLSGAQGSDYTGRPFSRTVVLPLELIYESIKNDPFLDKLVNSKMTDYLKLVISPVIMGGKSTIIELLDYYVLKHRENFKGVGNQPMTTYVTISFATIIINGKVMDVKSWKVTDPYAKTVAPTVINDEKELTSYYLTNTENEKIQDYKEEDIIILNLETQNRIGDIITINLDDTEYDFEYNGSLLPNDTLKNIFIESDLEQIELKVIKQKK